MVQMNAPQVNQRYDTSSGGGRSNIGSMNVGAVGGALGRLGQQLAKTGQDVSRIMEETALADDETTLLRMKQRLKEAHNKQLIFQDENPNDPLDWQTHRAKMLPNIEAQNNLETFHTDWGRSTSILTYESWLSDTGMEVDRSSHAKIFKNRIEVGIVDIKNSLEEMDVNSAQNSLDLIKDNLAPKVVERIQQDIDDKGEEYIWNDGVDEVRSDPSGYLKDAEAGNGFGEQHFEGAKGREKREKLVGIAKTERNKQAIEQLEAIDLQRLENPAWTLEDLEKADSRGELNQLTDLEKAKVYASMQRTEDPSNEEMVSLYGMLDMLRSKKKTLTKEEYIKLYHSTNLSIRAMLPSKGYGYYLEDLKALNPSAKQGRTGSTENRRANRAELTGLIVSAQKMGDMDDRPDKGGRKKKDRYGNSEYDYSGLEPSQLHIQGMKMRDVEEKMMQWMESSDVPLTNEDIRTKFGVIMSGGKITSVLERQQAVTEFPYLPDMWNTQRVSNPNTFAEGYNAEYPNQSPASSRPKQTGEFKKASPKASTKPPTTTGGSYNTRVDVDPSQGAANVRYNNPAAAYPRKADEKYGVEGYGIIGGGHKIAKFPTPVHGAAANFDLFSSNYTNMTFKAAIKKWRGRDSPVPSGYNPNEVIDKDFLNNKDRSIDFFKKMALHESPDFKGMTESDWIMAWEMWQEEA